MSYRKIEKRYNKFRIFSRAHALNIFAHALSYAHAQIITCACVFCSIHELNFLKLVEINS
jgi:hypothetical protein